MNGGARTISLSPAPCWARPSKSQCGEPARGSAGAMRQVMTFCMPTPISPQAIPSACKAVQTPRCKAPWLRAKPTKRRWAEICAKSDFLRINQQVATLVRNE